MKNRVLTWIGKCLKTNVSRGKIWNQVNHGNFTWHIHDMKPDLGLKYPSSKLIKNKQ